MSPIDLVPWNENGYELLVRLNAPDMTEHVGGPETEVQVRYRHERYLASALRGPMFLIVLDGREIGSVGYWPREWRGRAVYETGYGVLPEYQGRGFAVAALQLCAERAAREGTLSWLHAFPAVGNAASNAVCRKAGFDLVGECAFEYPPGVYIKSNDWRLRLAGPARPPAPQSPPIAPG
jgi:RimJ/RimL family protein N-acetyltransferase